MSASNLHYFAVKCLALPAAIIGSLQAAVWLVLSLISILYYNNQIEPNETSSYTSYGYVIYLLYLQSNSTTDYLINPESFDVVMYFYMILSFVWLIISADLFWVIQRKKRDKISTLLVWWSAITILITILDVIMMSLLAADLHQNQTVATDESTSTTESPSTTESISEIETTYLSNIDTQTVSAAITIVMSLAARGYVLLILNVTFAVLLAISVYKNQQKNTPIVHRPIINAYGTRPKTLYDQVEIDKSFQNEGFQSDEYTFALKSYQNNENGKNPLSNSNRSSLAYSQSPAPYSFETVEPLKLPSIQTGRLAKIGKAGGRKSPPRRVPSPTVPTTSNGSPHIPEPDYTPPHSPKFKPKSVLRPKSNYEL
ncbi:uncharacterized protein LOC130898764 [Diorhabda carinulata]|uniref:uncharacterized protein LOC130898764 n=1 Tax=Diorhabda carinulata TaxID=1163345 RepID=UPI0025A14400|nr:uncharacterized protein LOC130898764 [Diorhabda carinulata]